MVLDEKFVAQQQRHHEQQHLELRDLVGQCVEPVIHVELSENAEWVCFEQLHEHDVRWHHVRLPDDSNKAGRNRIVDFGVSMSHV